MDYLLYLDQSPVYKERGAPRTWAGAALTLVCYGFVVAMASYFFALYVTEAATEFVNESTLGQTYNVRFRCVSIGGCNVSYEYSPDGECGELAGLRGSNHTDGEDFLLQVCRARNPKEGVRVRTTFERNAMWLAKNVLWSVEMYQQGQYIPIGEVEQNRVKIVRLRNTAIIDSSKFRERTQVRGSFWTEVPTSSILFDSECFAAGTPGGFICGSIQFTLTELFVREEKKLANNLRADFVAPSIAVFTGVNLIMMVVVTCVHTCAHRGDKADTSLPHDHL